MQHYGVLWAISKKQQGVGSWYFVRTLVRRCRCTFASCGLDFTFDLTIVTLTFKILSGLYRGSCKVWEVDTLYGH